MRWGGGVRLIFPYIAQMNIVVGDSTNKYIFYYKMT